METSAYDSLLLHVRTKVEADFLIDKIEDLTNSLYQLTKESFSQIVRRNLPSNLGEALYSELSKHNLTFEHPKELKTYLTTLKELLQNMQTVSLTVSFSPSDELLTDISEKAKLLFGANVLVELHVQEDLIGGAIVVTHGKFTDASVKSKLSKVFQTNAQEIKDILQEGNKV